MDSLNSLFDFSFSQFITTKVIKLLYVALLIGGVVIGFGAVVAAFAQQGFLTGLAVLAFLVVFYAVYVLAVRIYCEILLVVFSIADDIHAMRLSDQKPTAEAT